MTRLACWLLGHRWSSWWKVVDDTDHGKVIGEFRVCKRCGAHDERDAALEDES